MGINILLGALSIGAFFITHGRLLKVATAAAFTLLFFVHTQHLVSPDGLTSVMLILINTFYLFKLFTHHSDKSQLIKQQS